MRDIADPTATRILLVSDNRDDVNWGCRATSLALSHLIEPPDAAPGSRRITARVSRSQVTTPMGFAPRSLVDPLPAAARGLLLRKVLPRILRRRQSPGDPGTRLQRLMASGSRGKLGGDFVSLDPRETAANILRNRELHPYYAQLCDAVEACDQVIVNGEGSLILRDPPRRDMLFQFGMLDSPREMGRPASYVNAMVSDPPATARSATTAAIARQALEGCDRVIVRDELSLEVLGAVAPGADGSVAPDALFSWAPRFTEPKNLLPSEPDALVSFPRTTRRLAAIDSTGPTSPSRAAHGRARPGASRKDLRQARHPAPRPRTADAPGADLQRRPVPHRGRSRDRSRGLPVRTPILQGGAILAGARVFISGRYHPSILATLGGARW